MIVLTSQLKIAYFARFRNEGTMFMPYSKIDVELSPSNVGTFLPVSFEREKLSIFLRVCVSSLRTYALRVRLPPSMLTVEKQPPTFAGSVLM